MKFFLFLSNLNTIEKISNFDPGRICNSFVCVSKGRSRYVTSNNNWKKTKRVMGWKPLLPLSSFLKFVKCQFHDSYIIVRRIIILDLCHYWYDVLCLLFIVLCFACSIWHWLKSAYTDFFKRSPKLYDDELINIMVES